MANNRFNLISLGCPKNRVDSERILAVMTAAGFTYTEDLSAANVVIVNTCSFIEPAVEESIDTILESRVANRRAVLVVAGCLPLRYREDLTQPLPEVDLFLTPERIEDLPHLVAEIRSKKVGRRGLGVPVTPCQVWGSESATIAGRGNLNARASRLQSPLPAAPQRVLTTSGYAYLKIAEGCSRSCSYCTIPQIRGPLRSFDIADLVEEAEFVAAKGAKELVLVAQDLTSYGRDRRQRTGLVKLLERVGQVNGIRWVRLMYLHPDRVTSELTALVRDSETILPYLDIPFQHVSGAVLRAMGRPWKGDRIRGLVDRLRKEIPGLVLRTTVMVGYPAEGEREFLELKNFVSSFEIERVGVFMYCPEENTKAMSLGDPVPQEVKEARADEIRSIHAAYTNRRNRGRIHHVETVLVEGVSDETEFLLQGRTWDQAPEIDGVLYITAGNAVAGEMHAVRITATHGPDLFGKIV